MDGPVGRSKSTTTRNSSSSSKQHQRLPSNNTLIISPSYRRNSFATSYYHLNAAYVRSSFRPPPQQPAGASHRHSTERSFSFAGIISCSQTKPTLLRTAFNSVHHGAPFCQQNNPSPVSRRKKSGGSSSHHRHDHRPIAVDVHHPCPQFCLPENLITRHIQHAACARA